MLIQSQQKVDFRIKRSKSLLSLCHFVTLSSLPGSKLRVSERKVKLAWTIPNVSSFAEGKAMKWQGQSYAMAHSKLWNEAVKAMEWGGQRSSMRNQENTDVKKRRVRNGQNKELGMKKHAFIHIFNTKKTKSMIKMNGLRKSECKRMLIVRVNKCKSSNSNFVCENWRLWPEDTHVRQ